MRTLFAALLLVLVSSQVKAQMSTPFWISDGQNDVLRYVDASGNISTPALTSTDPFWGGSFGLPWGIGFTPSGNLFVVDNGAKLVWKVTPALAVTRVAGGGFGAGALGYSFVDPYFVASDSKGNLYISDLGNHGGWVVVAVNMQGTTQTICNVSIAAGDIAVVAGNGTGGFSGDGGQATLAEIDNNYGIALDAADNLYISSQLGDNSGSVVRKVNQVTGIISSFAGVGTSGVASGFSGDGGAATSALLNRPLGLGSDASGNIYIADHANFCIRVVNNQGTAQTILNTSVGAGDIQTIAGTGTVQGFSGDGGPATSALLGEDPPVFTNDGPWAIALGLNEIFIADTFNFRIRHVDAAGVITTVAGNGTSGNSGDGGAATSAEFARVFGIAIPPPAGITIVKITVPSGAAQPFTFHPSWASAFVLHDGQSNNSGALAPGTYSITEDAVANWNTVVTGGDPTNIVVTPGSSITLLFTNTFVPPAKGRIIVHKVTNPVADPQVFTFRPSWGAPFVLGDGQENDSGPLDAGTYAVTEDPVDGWTTETSQDPSTIVVEDGSNTDITFTNTKTPICIVQPPETGVMKFARGIGDLNNEMLALEVSNEAVPGAWFELHEMVLYARPSAQSRKG